ncbi:MAG: SpoIID/LytB domain-containing protein [Spirochaetota bacterium]
MTEVPGEPEARGPAAHIRVLVAENRGHTTVHAGYADIQARGVSLSLPPAELVISPEGVQTPRGLVPLPAHIRCTEPLVIGQARYHGNLLITPAHLVNLVPLDLYVAGVVAAEVSPEWPLEALKAQAVVSRTFAYRRMLDSREQPYDVRDTEMDQRFLLAEHHPAVEQAVRATRDQVVLYQDRPIEAFFHSCSGGRTERSGSVFQADLPYLQSVPDPFCADGRSDWSATFDLAQVERAVAPYLEGGGNPDGGSGGGGAPRGGRSGLREIRMGRRTSSGRTGEFVLLYAGGDLATVAGNRFRLAVGPREMKSLLITRMSHERKDGRVLVTFQGRGYGHGVGMSQWGTYHMALRGYDYRRIIAYYYRGVRIGHTWDIR